MRWLPGDQVNVVYDIYLRRGKDTLHMFRWKGSADIERANRVFQEMVEEPMYAAALKPWDTIAFFGPNSAVGRAFPRNRRPDRPEPWFGQNPVNRPPAK